MKDMLKFAFILMTVTLIASGALALVNSVTAPKIAKQKQKELKQGLVYVLPESADGVIIRKQVDDLVFYAGYAKKDTSELTGYAFSCYGDGYSSTIWTLAGVDTSGLINRIRILDQKETPGLGACCTEVKSGDMQPLWPKQFQDKEAESVAVTKDGGAIESITGATITSRAIANSIAAKSKSLFHLLEKQE